MKLSRLDEVVGAGLSGAKRSDEKREMRTWRKMMELLNMVGWARNRAGRWRTSSEKRRKKTRVSISTFNRSSNR